MKQVKIGVIVVLVVLAAVFAAQNTEVVSVRFLSWELNMSMIVLLSGLLLVGAVAGFVLATLVFRQDRSQRHRGQVPDGSPEAARHGSQDPGGRAP